MPGIETAGHAGPPALEVAEARQDVVLSFGYASWATLVAREMSFPEDRLFQTLSEHPSVGKVLVAESFRSLPIKVIKDRLRPPPAFPPASESHTSDRPGCGGAIPPAQVPLNGPSAAGMPKSTRRCGDAA